MRAHLSLPAPLVDPVIRARAVSGHLYDEWLRTRSPIAAVADCLAAAQRARAGSTAVTGLLSHDWCDTDRDGTPLMVDVPDRAHELMSALGYDMRVASVIQGDDFLTPLVTTPARRRGLVLCAVLWVGPGPQSRALAARCAAILPPTPRGRVLPVRDCLGAARKRYTKAQVT